MKAKLYNSLKLILLFNLFTYCSISAQTQQSTHLHGNDNAGAQPKALIQTSDGGYAITGYIQSYKSSSSDIYVVKLDSMGNIQWTKTIGGSKDEEGASIVQTHDGGYAIAGYTSSYGAGGEDVYVIKLDKNGNVKWTKVLGGKSDDLGFSILETANGGLLIAGSSDSYDKEYEYIIKLDGDGNVKWTTGIPGSANSIIQARNGQFAVCGTAAYPWQNNILISKLDTMGNPIWNKVISDSAVNYSGIIHNMNQ